MTHAAAATGALREAVMPSLAPVSAAVGQAREAQAAFRAADDLVDVMEAAAGLILALEAMEHAAKTTGAEARAALAKAMSLGATQFRTASHVVSLKEGTRAVIITDAAAIPREFWTTPEPHPDKTEIGKLLRRGERVPGAELANYVADVVQIRNRNQRAA